jgi:hypothetical protein
MTIFELRMFVYETLDKIGGDTLKKNNAPEFFSHFTDNDYELFRLLGDVFPEVFFVKGKEQTYTLDKILIRKKN